MMSLKFNMSIHWLHCTSYYGIINPWMDSAQEAQNLTGPEVSKSSVLSLKSWNMGWRIEILPRFSKHNWVERLMHFRFLGLLAFFCQVSTTEARHDFAEESDGRTAENRMGKKTSLQHSMSWWMEIKFKSHLGLHWKLPFPLNECPSLNLPILAPLFTGAPERYPFSDTTVSTLQHKY